MFYKIRIVIIVIIALSESEIHMVDMCDDGKEIDVEDQENMYILCDDYEENNKL